MSKKLEEIGYQLGFHAAKFIKKMISNDDIDESNSNAHSNSYRSRNDDVPQSNRGSSTVKSSFKILEIESTETPEEVKAAYKRKIKMYHPDRVSGLGEKLKELANEESKAINSAYSFLKSKGMAS